MASKSHDKEAHAYINEILQYVSEQAELTKQIVGKIKNKDLVSNYLLNYSDTIRDKLDDVNRKYFPEGRTAIPVMDLNKSYQTYYSRKNPLEDERESNHSR